MHEHGENGVTHVLAVDDDPSVRDLVTTYLGDHDMRVTAVPDEQSMSKVLAREAGADAVLGKPVAAHDLATALARVLGRAP